MTTKDQLQSSKIPSFVAEQQVVKDQNKQEKMAHGIQLREELVAIDKINNVPGLLAIS